MKTFRNKIEGFVNFCKNRWFIFFATGFFIFSLIFYGGATAFEHYYKDKIYPRIKVNNISLSGMTREEGLKELRRVTDRFSREGLFFKYKNKEVLISPIITSAEDPDLSKEIFSFDLDKVVNEAYAVGRRGDKFFNIKNKIALIFNGRNITPELYLNKEELMDILANNFSSFEDPGRDAGIDIKYNGKNYNIGTIEEKLGKSFDYNFSVSEAEDKLRHFSLDPIEMYMKTDYPVIKKEKISEVTPQIEKVLALNPLTLKYKCVLSEGENDMCGDKKDIAVRSSDFISWITLVREGNSAKTAFDKGKVNDYLSKIAEKINISAQDAKLKIEDGRVLEFQESIDGVKLDIEGTFNDISENILGNSSSSAFIIVRTDVAKNSVGDINDLGIKELIGVGKSNFSGSPVNRRHNISVGAETLDGIIIRPDEEFSLVKTLGEIEAETGYLPELVIKGTKTVPEYGGGLCQIATTAFRLALDAGLPITERSPHAYRVSYYEPAGTDATIYVPKPDLMFKNNTGSHLLMQTKIEGDDLIFEFWGTSDGRRVELTEPRIFNIVEPGPTKIIETEDLKPGEKKCTESSHKGADAEFTRVITSVDGEAKEEVWSSRYRPWQAVCLVGKEKSDEIAEEGDGIVFENQ